MTDAGNSRYEPEGEIARGGMGVVLRVQDIDLDRPLAMKRMASAPDATGGGSESDRFARFMEEAQVTAQLDHPAIVPVHDLGFDDDGTGWYTMKLVEGRELGQIFDLARGGADGWSTARAVRVLVQVCQALAYAHGKGVIHRDLKPANIMVGEFGEVYVMDWGLAKVEGSEVSTPRAISGGEEVAGGSMVTLDGSVMGTPEFMPPEQARGEMDAVDEQSDVYSVGAMLYQLLAGRPPFLGESREVVKAVAAGPPEPLSKDAPPELVAICNKAMARDKAKRYGSMAELEVELQSHLDGRVVKAHETGAWAEIKKVVSRNKALSAMVAVAVLSLFGFTVTQLLSKQRLDRANTQLKNSLVAEEESRAETVKTLAEMYTSQGMNETKSMRAALWFSAAGRLQSTDPVALHESRTRVRSWTDQAFVPLRAFRLQGQQRTRDASFHPSLPLLIVESRDRAEVWDLRGMEQPMFPDKAIRCAAWNPVSGHLAISGSDGRVSIHDLLGEKVVATLEPDLGMVTRLVFSDDGLLLGVGGDALRIWDLENGEWVGPKRQHSAAVASITFSPDNQHVATASGSEARLFAVQGDSSQPLHEPFPHYRWVDMPVYLFKPTFVGGQLVTHGGDFPNWTETFRKADYRIRFWDLQTGDELRSAVHYPRLIDPSGRILYTDRAIVDLQTDRKLVTLVNNTHSAVGDFTPDGSALISWKESGSVYRSRDAALVKTMGEGFQGGALAHALRVAPNGRYFALVLEGNPAPQVIVFSSWIEPQTVTIRGGDGAPSRGALSEDHRYFAVAGMPEVYSHAYDLHRARVYSTETGDPVGPFLPAGGDLLTSAFSRDGNALLIGSGLLGAARENANYLTGYVQLWDWRSGRALSERITLPSEPRKVVRSPSGEGFVVLCHRRELVRLDQNLAMTVLSQREESDHYRVPRQREDDLSITVLSDGRLVCHGRTEEIHVWSAEAIASTGSPMVIKCEPQPCYTRAANDQTVFVTDRQKAELAMFDIEKGIRMPDLSVKPGALSAVSWSRDHQLLLTGSDSGVARVWNLDESHGMSLVSERGDDAAVLRSEAVPETPWVLSQFMGKRLQLWSLNSGHLVAPPIALESSGRLRMDFLKGSKRVLIGPLAVASVVDLSTIEPDPLLSFADEEMLAEIHAHGRIAKDGSFVKMTREEWFSRWREFRKQHPNYHDRLINPTAEVLAQWHREQTLNSYDSFAYAWHLKRWAELSGSAEARERMGAD